LHPAVGPPLHPAVGPPLQPYLRKIFEGINSLQFEKNGDVTAMISEEGENVAFSK
jgi:hypothetical protein